MNKQEAIARARAFVRENARVDADPESIRFTTNLSNAPVWSAFYSVEQMYPEEIAAGTTIDGGEYIVEVNDETGEVVVFAPPQ